MINLLNKINKLKLDNKKMIFVALVCLTIFYIDLSFIMKLQLGGIRNITPKLISLKKDINNLAKDLSVLQDLDRNAKQGKAQAAAIKPKEIVTEDKILLILQEVSDLANENRVKVVQIKTSKDAKVKEEVIAGERLLPIIITLDLSCGYHSLGSFINNLENAGHFIEIEDIKIVRAPQNYLLENVNLMLKTYVRK